MAQGGRGGNARVVGERGSAQGGPGGDGGGESGGRGGDGGSAEVHGEVAVAIGGAGGHAGTSDGRGGRRAKSVGELHGFPTWQWRFGSGGAGANAPEYNRRLALLTRFRREYCESFPSDAPFIDAGVDVVPVAWINRRLEEEGERWQVEMGAGGYVLPPLAP